MSGYLGRRIRLHLLLETRLFFFFFFLPFFLYLTLQRHNRAVATYGSPHQTDGRPFEDEKLASRNNLIFTVIARGGAQFTEVPRGPLSSSKGEKRSEEGGDGRARWRTSRVPVTVRRTSGVTNEAENKRANERTVSHN